MAQHWIFGTLRSRIFAALFAISLIPIAALGIQGYHCAMEAVYELAQKHVLAVADGRASTVRRWVEERVQRMELIASLPTTGALLLEGRLDDGRALGLLQRSLDQFRSAEPTFSEVVLMDRAWRPLVKSHAAGHTHHSLVDSDLEAKAEGSSGAVYGVAHGHISGDVGLHVVCAIPGPDGSPVGYLAAYLNLAEQLTPMLQDREGLYQTGKVFIVSGDGLMLTAPLPGDAVIFAPWQKGASEAAHHHGPSLGVTTYLDYRQERVLGAAIPIGFEDWQLVTEVDRDEALIWLDVLLMRSLGTGLVTCVLVILLAFWMSRLVGKPLRQLMTISHRIRKGSVGERLPVMDVAEAEEVRLAFNAMLDELKEKQEELVRTTTLAYVGELTSSTVHEMRNPLSSIKMNLQVLTRAAGQDAENQELGEIALQQATRLEHMLTDLLSFGKPVEVNRTRVRFEALAESVQDVLASTAAQNQSVLRVDDQLGDQTLNVDKEQFCRVLTNLVSNALEAQPTGGDVAVIARSVHGEERGAEIVVEDGGPGLSPEALQRLFQPFYTTKSNGTGLGLPNVKKIVELHGGTIKVENRTVGGARFRIWLPTHGAKEE